MSQAEVGKTSITPLLPVAYCDKNPDALLFFVLIKKFSSKKLAQ